MRSTTRAAVAVFLVLFIAYGYFHQGGGWNQTVRFDQARALVETGSFAIDDYLFHVLEVTESGEVDYRRLALSDPQTRTRRLANVNSYDLSVFEGHLYPNKPPGVALLAAAAYAPIHVVERALGIDPDRWLPLTVNAYLTSLLAIALVGALGGVAFFGLGLALFPGAGVACVFWATLAYGLGTQIFPYSTMMFDHAPVCAVSISAFALLARRRVAGGAEGGIGAFVAAGLLAGFAVVLNRAAALVVLALLAYVILALRSPRALVGFVAGGCVPAALLFGYQAVVFGHPLSLSETHQLAYFSSPSAIFLGSFEWPRLHLLPDLLIRPYRGFLFWSPVLALTPYGLFRMGRDARLRPELLVIIAVAVLYLVFNLSFSRWHGGGGVGARYLTPAVPFLALALIPTFQRFPRLSAAVACFSLALMLMATSINPMVHGRYQNPLTDYYLPLALGGELDEGYYSVRGPVSVHPSGVAGAGLEIFSPSSRFGQWNAFNLGELLFPGSWWSLLPLGLAQGAVLLWLFAPLRRETPARRPTQESADAQRGEAPKGRRPRE